MTTLTALIVGSAGHDGRLLIAKLRELHYSVVGVTRETIDIKDPNSVNKLVDELRPKEVYFLAAYHKSSEDVRESDGILFRESMSTNALPAVNFLDAIATFSPRTRFFYASSSHIFAPCENGLQSEETELKPESPYAVSKVCGMMACRYYRKQKDVFACSGILYNHESPTRSSRFVTRKIAEAAVRIASKGGGALTLGNIDAMVDWGYAPDYVDAMHRMLQTDQPQDFVIATGEAHSVKEFARLAFMLVGLDIQDHLEIEPQLLSTQSFVRIGDSARLKMATGWAPTVSFEKLVEIMVSAEIERALITTGGDDQKRREPLM